jgi:hypothetical protein
LNVGHQVKYWLRGAIVNKNGHTSLISNSDDQWCWPESFGDNSAPGEGYDLPVMADMAQGLSYYMAKGTSSALCCVKCLVLSEPSVVLSFGRNRDSDRDWDFYGSFLSFCHK